MKYIMRSFSVLAAMVLLTGCQQDAPDIVKKAFSARFESATDIEWEQEDDGWEAEFEIGEQEFTSFFTAGGEWMETETAFAIDSLPDDVLETLYSQYPDYDIMEAEWLETPEFKGYEVEMAIKGDEETEIEVLITPIGQIMRKESENETAEEAE